MGLRVDQDAGVDLRPPVVNLLQGQFLGPVVVNAYGVLRGILPHLQQLCLDGRGFEGVHCQLQLGPDILVPGIPFAVIHAVPAVDAPVTAVQVVRIDAFRVNADIRDLSVPGYGCGDIAVLQVPGNEPDRALIPAEDPGFILLFIQQIQSGMLRPDGFRGQADIIRLGQQAFTGFGISGFRNQHHGFAVVPGHFPDAFHLPGDAVYRYDLDFIRRTHPDIYREGDQPGAFSFVLGENGGAAHGLRVVQRGFGCRDGIRPGNIAFRGLRISGQGKSQGIRIPDAVRIHLCVRHHVMQLPQGGGRHFMIIRAVDAEEGFDQVIRGIRFGPVGSRAVHFQGSVRIFVLKGDGIGAVHDILREQGEIPVCRNVFVAPPEAAVQGIAFPVRRIQAVPEFRFQRGERVGFRLFIGHVALSGQVGDVFIEIADIRQDAVEPVLLLQGPGSVVAAEGLAADFHNGFLFIVPLAALQDLHQGVILLQGKAVLVERLNQMRELLRRIILGRHDAGIVFLCHRDGHLFHNFPLAQQHRGNGDG